MKNIDRLLISFEIFQSKTKYFVCNLKCTYCIFYIMSFSFLQIGPYNAAWAPVFDALKYIQNNGKCLCFVNVNMVHKLVTHFDTHSCPLAKVFCNTTKPMGALAIFSTTGSESRPSKIFGEGDVLPKFQAGRKIEKKQRKGRKNQEK